MTERVLGPTGSRSRTTRASLFLMALMALVFGVLIGGGGIGSAASGPGVDDYSQCADGKADTSDGCPSGWINGILNTNNSSYHEDQVTPQRLVVSNLPAGNHTFHLRYLIRKADNHAYDSLATWDHTQSDALRCTGFAGNALSACNAATGGSPSVTPIPADPLVVNSSCNSPSGSPNNITSTHQLANQEFQMFGGTLATLTSADYKGTSSDSEGTYQSIDVRFSTSGAKSTVYFYFGGHLARGEGGWGEGCGAGGISGGPYHIKLDGLDAESIGNRDNQIMSGAILPLADATIASTPAGTPTTTWSASLSDSATVTGDNPTGDVIFRLYAPGDATCTTAIFTNQKTLSSGSATSDPFTNIGSAGTYGAGTYQWTVEYLGDSGNNPAGPTACGDTSEQSTVTAATNATVT